MSYNREWDQGKDWGQSDYNQGDYYYNNRNTRARDDDLEYSAGEKRRRYNNQDSYSQYDQNNQGYWSQSQGSQSHDYYDDRRGGPGGGHRRRMTPSEPTQHVIFLGLDTDFTEGDLQAYLQDLNCSLDSVTIIRDRGTGLSKGFGFAQFTSVEHARTFLEPNFPFVNVPPPASHGASAAAAFKAAIASGGHHGGRRVKIDFSQSAHNSDRGRARMPSNDGTRDIGTSPSTLVLLRGLDPITIPATVSFALRTAAGPGKDGSKGMRRIMLIKDKTTGLGCGFVFLEFVDQNSASNLLGCLMSPHLHPAGFRINDKPIAASFAHPFSFQPLGEHGLRDDTCIASSNNVGGGEGFWVKYWDDGTSVAEMTFEVEEPDPEVVGTVKPKKRATDDQVSSFLGTVSKDIKAAEATASALPISDKPVTLSLTKSAATFTKPNPSAAVVRPTGMFTLGGQDETTESGETTAGGQVQEDAKAIAGRKVAPLIASKKVANRISKWNNVQVELSGRAPVATEAPVAEVATPIKPLPPVEHSDFDYADSKKMACYLCSRQFKSLEQLRRHNIESDLHKKNLQDVKLRELAYEKAAGTRDALGGESNGRKYRDRAQERRALHHQPDGPVLDDSLSKTKKRSEAAPPPPPPPPAAPPTPAKDESNVGNKLLQKMGWSLGTGLGFGGEGRVDPIQTAIYAPGAGLGASKGKDISKLTESGGGYLGMARDSARERFEESR